MLLNTIFENPIPDPSFTETCQKLITEGKLNKNDMKKKKFIIAIALCNQRWLSKDLPEGQQPPSVSTLIQPKNRKMLLKYIISQKEVIKRQETAQEVEEQQRRMIESMTRLVSSISVAHPDARQNLGRRNRIELGAIQGPVDITIDRENRMTLTFNNLGADELERQRRGLNLPNSNERDGSRQEGGIIVRNMLQNLDDSPNSRRIERWEMIDLDEVIWGRFGCESGLRCSLRILSFGVMLILFILHLLTLKSKFSQNQKYLPNGEKSHQKPFIVTGQDSIHIQLLQRCCFVKILENILSTIDFIHAYCIKRRMFVENYIHTASKILFFVLIWYLLGSRVNFVWGVVLLDFSVTVTLIITSCYRIKESFGRPVLMFNYLCFIPTFYCHFMVGLKVQGFVGSWAIILAPAYIMGLMLIAGGIAMIVALKYSYRDVYGEFKKI